MAKINFITPYTPNKQLAKHYNEQAARFPDDEWVCFMDADAMFLLPNFGQHLEQIIDKHGNDYLALTCITNRVGNLKQCHGRQISHNFDIIHHINIAEKRARESGLGVVDFKPAPPMSGVLILAKVSTIKRIPFRGHRMLGVDNNFHQDICKHGNFGLMLGVYIFHKYRPGNIKNIKHLT